MNLHVSPGRTDTTSCASIDAATATGFIEPDWLEAVGGKLLFYPAAGPDMAPFVTLFAPAIRDFRFNDLWYYSTRSDELLTPAFERVTVLAKPDPDVRDQPVQRIDNGSGVFRDITSSVLVERFVGPSGEITISRRKGFGQYALGELPERSIGVIVHRSDSEGQGGSNTWFLANRNARHPPVGRLWEKLSQRLADRAVSDGSLTDFKFLKATKNVDAKSLYERGFGLRHEGFDWRCVGYMTDRPSAIWGLTRGGPLDEDAHRGRE